MYCGLCRKAASQYQCCYSSEHCLFHNVVFTKRFMGHLIVSGMMFSFWQPTARVPSNANIAIVITFSSCCFVFMFDEGIFRAFLHI